MPPQLRLQHTLRLCRNALTPPDILFMRRFSYKSIVSTADIDLRVRVVTASHSHACLIPSVCALVLHSHTICKKLAPPSSSPVEGSCIPHRYSAALFGW